MTVFGALTNAIRTTLVLALVGFLASGSLAGPVSAATGDHHGAVMDGDHDRSVTAPANCPAEADGASHDMGDGSCCVGTCSTIIGVLPVADIPTSRIDRIEPSDHPVSARSGTVEFLRPPSQTI